MHILKTIPQENFRLKFCKFLKMFKHSDILKNKWLPFVFCIPLFFCLHPYSGIIHDTRLYLLAVVNRFYPERFINDPAFMFGNQDSYGFFSFLYGVFIKIFGVSSGTEILCVCIYSLWIVAVLLFLKNLCNRCNQQHLFFPLSIIYICLTASKMPFTGVAFFCFVEPFTCSRTLSVALGILGFAFFIDGKKYLSLCAFLAGFAVHPITAGWCLPVWLFFFYPKIRYPIAVISLLLPLTFILHWGPFDIYPENWANATLHHHVSSTMLIREAIGVCFFGLVAKNFTTISFFKRLSSVLFWVMLIAFYWTATGGVGKHIFIYQVQTWRIEWLMWVFVIPLYTIVLCERTKFLIDTKTLSLHDVCFILWGFILLLPNHDIFFSLAVLIFSLKKAQQIRFDFFEKLIGIFSLYVLILQNVIDMEFSTGFAILSGIFPFRLLWANMSFYVLVEFLLLALLIGHKIKSKGFTGKNIIALILLVVFGIHSQFMGIPVLIVSLYVQLPINKKILITVSCALAVFDAFAVEGLRTANCISLLIPYLNLWWEIFVVASLSLLLISINKKVFPRKFLTPVIIMASLGFCGFAWSHFDERSEERVATEKGIDVYFEETIFPQIANRDKMLFYVQGCMENSSRVQFLTGNYFDYNTHNGEMLFEKQFILAQKRDNLLYYKADLGISAPVSGFDDFLRLKMTNSDSLMDRVSFLCEINEIEHLVTHYPNLPLPRLDSTTLYNKQNVYLYGCKK